MTPITELNNLGDLLKYEAPNRYSRDVATIAAGQNLPLGTVLGRNASDGKHYAIDPAATDGTAERAAELTGRLISDEGPVRPGTGQPSAEMTRMSPAALLGWWHDTDGLNVYRPYLVADGTADLPPGLVAIDSPAPTEGSNVNWLNIFYAVEWAIFAGFAFYMWYRLAKDTWEKEVEALEEARAPVPSDHDGPPPADD